MARFFSRIQGQAGAASRLGSPRSGIEAEARGWDVGVKVSGETASIDGKDVDHFRVYATGGSNDPSGTYLGSVMLNAYGKPTFYPAESYSAGAAGL